jgi:4-amino-4-deoxy-L-arabinose transferase-like glycosyltransferase
VRWFGIVFILAVLARIVAQVALGAYVQPDVFEYEAVASNLVNGKGYTYASPDGGIYVASQSSPLYIVLTAGVYLLTNHSQAAMLLLQALFGGATAVLALWLGANAFSRPAGIVAGMLVGLDPALIAYSTELHSLTLDALVDLALVCGSVALPPRPGASRLGSLGALFGLAALTRATALLLLPLHLLWLRRFRAVRLMSAAAAVLVYTPWPVRNSLLLGELVPGSSETTEWLWRGNNPHANGASLTTAGQRMIDLAPPEFRARVAAADEAERIAIYRDAAFDFIRSQPLSAVGLYIAKLKAFWWGSESTGLVYPPEWVLRYRLWYVGILTAAGYGAWRNFSHPRQGSVITLIVTMLVVVSTTQALFYVEGRHRFAIEPLLIVLAGPGLVQLAQFVSARLSPRRALSTVEPTCNARANAK